LLVKEATITKLGIIPITQQFIAMSLS